MAVAATVARFAPASISVKRPAMGPPRVWLCATLLPSVTVVPAVWGYVEEAVVAVQLFMAMSSATPRSAARAPVIVLGSSVGLMGVVPSVAPVVRVKSAPPLSASAIPPLSVSGEVVVRVRAGARVGAAPHPTAMSSVPPTTRVVALPPASASSAALPTMDVGAAAVAVVLVKCVVLVSASATPPLNVSVEVVVPACVEETVATAPSPLATSSATPPRLYANVPPTVLERLAALPMMGAGVAVAVVALVKFAMAVAVSATPQQSALVVLVALVLVEEAVETVRLLLVMNTATRAMRVTAPPAVPASSVAQATTAVVETVAPAPLARSAVATAACVMCA